MVSFLYSRLALIGLFSVIFSLSATAQSGLVYRDFNSNGVADATADFGLPDIIIRAYRPDGTLSGSAVSSSTGHYTLTPSATPGELTRVDFSLPAAYAGFYPSAYTALSGGSGTSVQFVTGPATDVNYGINLPGDFCDTTPPLSIVCFVIGAGINVGDNLIATVPANSTGTPDSGTASAPGSATVGHPSALPNLVGSIWGTAWQPETNRLFSAAFVRRHTAMGSGGTGAIYVTSDPRNPANSSSALFLNLNGMTVSSSTGGSLSINTGINPHMTDAYYQTIKGPNDPVNMFFSDLAHPGGNPADAVGKVGLGDMDLSNDQRYLYVINLGQNHLYRITIDADNNPATNPTATDVMAYPLPDPGCLNGEARAFGLGVRGEKVFVGTICDGAQIPSGDVRPNANNLKATIYVLDPETTLFSTAISFPLNYGRGQVSGGEFPIPKGNWQPWNADLIWSESSGDVGQVFSLGNPDRAQVSSPQPMLTDIAFDDDGSLVAAFGDRFGHMNIFRGPDPAGTRRSDGLFMEYDSRAGGDILRICNVGTLAQPVYQLEQNGKCGLLGGGQFTDASYGNDGSGNPIPGEFEYYTGDNFNNTSHTETTMGSVVIVPGSGELIVTAFDPIRESAQGSVHTSGFKVLSNRTGQYARAFSLLNDIPQHNGDNYFGKASGLGSIEVLCLPKPLEIGNRIWLDTNENGVQDASETPLAGVQLELINDREQVVGQTITDALGSYIFNQSNVTDAASASQLAKPGVRVFSDYTIRVAASQFNRFGTGVLTNLIPTSTTVNTGDGSDSRDSNAGLLGNLAGFSYKTGQSGQSDHTLDIGFKAGKPLLALTKVVSATQVSIGTPLSYTVQLGNTGTASASALVVQDLLDVNLVFVSATPSTGTFTATGSGGIWNLPTLTPDQTATLIIQAIANQVGTLRNQATLNGQTATATTVVFCHTGVCIPIEVQRLVR